ncbi:MAG: tetratricopeptide repeat protein [Treponema sp.]|jgi:putative GTP pyrophosphokinase|nr:tetratricopeptide repeat protein [Treponema sp.]
MRENKPIPSRKKLREVYDRHAETRARVTRDLEIRIGEALGDLPSTPTVKSRSKDFSSYFKKYIRVLRQNKGDEKSAIITDLIGLRIVCPFIEDIARVQETLQNNFEVLEVDHKGSDHTFREFGYQSTHLLIRIPRDIIGKQDVFDIDVAEIQIRTILQDAWAEVEHELVYKAEFTPFDDPIKHKLAAVNASLSLADIIFQEIRNYQRQLNGQMGKRRDSFFKKIEETADAFMFEESQAGTPLLGASLSPIDTANVSMDDLLLNALYAHNKNQFSEAITYYSRILKMNPDNSISSLVYKHRGMANFAQSLYQDAIEDFTCALKLDPSAYKAAYYRGIVKSVLLQYPEAAEDFTYSLEINPYQPFSLYRRGQVYYHLEDYSQALADCEAALVLEPGNESFEKLRQLILKKFKM